MNTAYADMNADIQVACNRATDTFTEWLNSWHEAQQEVWTNDAGETVPVRVSKGNYFEYDDSPRLLLDSGLDGETYYRILVFSVNPYHDEGGPNELTCYYDEDGDLRHMDQLFDTNIQPVWEDGKFVNAPEEVNA